MKKAFMISGVFFLLAVGCAVAYNMSPNYVAEDGTLVEAFGFIPLMYLFGFSGIISLIIGIVLYYKHKK